MTDGHDDQKSDQQFLDDWLNEISTTDEGAGVDEIVIQGAVAKLRLKLGDHFTATFLRSASDKIIVDSALADFESALQRKRH